MKLEDKYVKSLKRLNLTGKNKEIEYKMDEFMKTGKGFSVRLLQRDFNLVINRGGMFLERIRKF